jgi:hypothetical protein
LKFDPDKITVNYFAIIIKIFGKSIQVALWRPGYYNGKNYLYRICPSLFNALGGCAYSSKCSKINLSSIDIVQ